jgi:hypothetical protein
MADKRPARGGGRTAPARRPARAGRPTETVVPLDAEDIAMARLQAHLRKTEAIRAPSRGVATLSRTTVRLPREMLQQVRNRARREGVTVSDIVEVALKRYLRTP